MDINIINIMIAVCAGAGVLFLWMAFFSEESGLLDKAIAEEKWDADTVIEDKNSAITGQLILPLAQKLIPYTQKYVSEKQLLEIKQKLTAAGEPFNIKPIEFYNFRYAMGIIGFVAGAIGVLLVKEDVTLMPIAGIAGMLIGAFVGPQNFLSNIMKERRATLNKELPNYLNLLSVCLKSGLDFIQSLRVINGYVTGLLPKELNLVILGVAQGETLTEAMKGFNDRCKHEGVESFYQTIRGIEKFGQLGTVADKINQLSKDIQDKMFENVKKRAASAEQKIYIPAVLILIALCIIVGGPIGMDAMKDVSL